MSNLRYPNLQFTHNLKIVSRDTTADSLKTLKQLDLKVTYVSGVVDQMSSLAIDEAKSNFVAKNIFPRVPLTLSSRSRTAKSL